MPLHRRKFSPDGPGRQDAPLAGQRQGRRMCRRSGRQKQRAAVLMLSSVAASFPLFVQRLVVEQGARRTRALLVIGWYPGIPLQDSRLFSILLQYFVYFVISFIILDHHRPAEMGLCPGQPIAHLRNASNAANRNIESDWPQILSSRSDDSRRNLLRCRHGSTRRTGYGRASKDRTGTFPVPPKTGLPPFSSSEGRCVISRWAISWLTSYRFIQFPDPVGHSTLKSSP